MTDSEQQDNAWKQLQVEARAARRSCAAFDIAARALELDIDWTRTIKTIREFHGDTLNEALRRCLGNRHWHMTIQKSLDQDERCWKQARTNFDSDGDKALVTKQGARFVLKPIEELQKCR